MSKLTVNFHEDGNFEVKFSGLKGVTPGALNRAHIAARHELTRLCAVEAAKARDRTPTAMELEAEEHGREAGTAAPEAPEPVLTAEPEPDEAVSEATAGTEDAAEGGVEARLEELGVVEEAPKE